MTNPSRAERIAANVQQRLIRTVDQRKQAFTPEEWLEYRADYLDVFNDPDNSDGFVASSWTHEVSLEDALRGGSPPMPDVCTWLDDGGATRALFYRNEIHSVFGEPESLKSWLLFLTSRQLMESAEHVLYFDMESNKHAVVDRLKAMGVKPKIIRKYFHYYKPDGPITPDSRERWQKIVYRRKPALVVLDGVTEAFATQGKDINSQVDTALWYRQFSRQFLVDPEDADYAGPAVVEVDHVVKDRDSRGGNPIGAQHKLAGLKGAAYSIENIKPLSKGVAGYSRIFCEKDSAGGVTWVWTKKRRLVGDLRIDATDPSGAIDAHIEPAQPAGDISVDDIPASQTLPFRHRMHEAWEFIKVNVGCSGKNIKSNVTASPNDVAAAVEQLVLEGYIENRGTPSRHAYAVVLGRQFDPMRAEPIPNRDVDSDD